MSDESAMRVADRPDMPTVPPRNPTEPESTNGLDLVTTAQTAPAVQPPSTRQRLLRRIVPIGVIILIVAGVVGFNAWRDGVLFVSTDNAQITGQPVQVGAMNAGRVDVINPSIGSLVRKGDILATVSLPHRPAPARAGRQRWAFSEPWIRTSTSPRRSMAW